MAALEASVSALLKPSALVASSLPSSVLARRQRQRIRLREHDALAVSLPTSYSCQSSDLVLIAFSIGARPVGECTCDRASTENTKVNGSTCSCGQRPAGK